MKLHYSQTIKRGLQNSLNVLSPYEITLFSNDEYSWVDVIPVLSPYEITLFSNKLRYQRGKPFVLSPYEITLFSNFFKLFANLDMFYHLMKLHYSQTYIYIKTALYSFITL